MHHGPAVKMEKDSAWKYKEKLGVVLFIIYCIVYAAFVLINTLNPKLMEVIHVMGLNLATFYGFGLIVLAVIMGFVYNHLCTRMEKKMGIPDGKEAAKKEEDK